MAPRLLPRRKAIDVKSIENEAMVKASAAVLKAAGIGQGQGKVPGTYFSNNQSRPVNPALIARVTNELASAFGKPPPEIEVALAEQGLSWGPPFPPGRPLEPFWGIGRPPRTRDFTVGENVQITPRWGRMSFATLKAIIDSYDVAQICIRHLINDVRSLNYRFEPIRGVRDDVTEELKKAREFFGSPDKRQPFRSWIAEYLQDVLRYDAGSLYIRRNEADEPIALEVVSGTTIMPLQDYFGRIPTDEDDGDPDLTAAGTFHGKITPAFVQIIQGMPWDWLPQDDMIYQPWNPLPDSQYGLAPMEAVMITANTDLRFQWHFLQYFTEGTLPAGFMEAPEDMSDPAQLSEWQNTWDALMMGDQAMLRQIRWVPHGSKFASAKEHADKFEETFPLYLMRRVAASFGVTPNDLGFTESVNRATGDTQIDVQFRVGTLPLVRHVEDVVNFFIQEILKLRVQLAFDTGRETEDRISTARANAIYIEKGVLSPDEVRRDLGYPVSARRPIPRFIDNTRAGPIPLLSLESLAGETDYDTYSPTHDAPLIDHQFASLPGVAPVIGSPEYKTAQDMTAQMQADLLDANLGPDAERDGDRPPPGKPKKAPSKRPNPATAKPTAQDPAKPKPKPKPKPKSKVDTKIAKVLEEWGSSLITALKEAEGGSPGITASTGIQGVDLLDDESEESDDDEMIKALSQWQENTINRLRKGRPPKRFESDIIASVAVDVIHPALVGCSTPAQVRSLFTAIKQSGVLHLPYGGVAPSSSSVATLERVE